MPYNRTKKSVAQLWAVIDENGCVMVSRGGSSSTPRLMVYGNPKSAQTALKSPWIKQIMDTDSVSVQCIYDATAMQPAGKEGEA